MVHFYVEIVYWLRLKSLLYFMVAFAIGCSSAGVECSSMHFHPLQITGHVFVLYCFGRIRYVSWSMLAKWKFSRTLLMDAQTHGHTLSMDVSCIFLPFAFQVRVAINVTLAYSGVLSDFSRINNVLCMDLHTNASVFVFDIHYSGLFDIFSKPPEEVMIMYLKTEHCRRFSESHFSLVEQCSSHVTHGRCYLANYYHKRLLWSNFLWAYPSFRYVNLVMDTRRWL